MKILLILAALLSSLSANAKPRPKLPWEALPVPIIRQSTEYSCGAAALLSVLFYWDAYDGGEASLFAPLNTTEKDGTEPPKIIEVAEKLGLKAFGASNLSIDDLRRFLKQGMPVILDIQAWHLDGEEPPASWKDDWDDGHYVVLVGLDHHYAYFMDPSTSGSYGFIPIPELLDRWHDYEDRNGVIERYEHFGIALSGESAINDYPKRLQRIR